MDFLPQEIHRQVHFESPTRTIPMEVTEVNTQRKAAYVWDIILKPILTNQEWDYRRKYLLVNSQDERDRQITILINTNLLDVYVDGRWYRILRSLIVDPVLFNIRDPKEFLCELFDDLLNVTFKIKMERYA